MKKLSIEDRATLLAHYIIETKDTVRSTAKKFGVSKSTVHKDVSDRLLKINPVLAKQVREILDENKAERHLRGGMATKLKYLKEKEGWQFRIGDGSFFKKEPSPFRKNHYNKSS